MTKSSNATISNTSCCGYFNRTILSRQYYGMLGKLEADIKGSDKWLHPSNNLICNYMSLPYLWYLRLTPLLWRSFNAWMRVRSISFSLCIDPINSQIQVYYRHSWHEIAHRTSTTIAEQCSRRYQIVGTPYLAIMTKPRSGVLLVSTIRKISDIGHISIAHCISFVQGPPFWHVQL